MLPFDRHEKYFYNYQYYVIIKSMYLTGVMTRVRFDLSRYVMIFICIICLLTIVFSQKYQMFRCNHVFEFEKRLNEY
jgi:hypothetical protein